jgi:voltage-gated potassium channel
MTSRRPDPQLEQERSTLEENLARWLEWPMTFLALVWLALLIIELVRGVSPALEQLGLIIWGIFIVEFVLRLAISTHRLEFLKRNWFTGVTLLLPALRAFRVLRLARAIRGVRLVRILGSVNRGMNSIGRAMQRRGLSYVVAVTIIVVLLGAAGMYAFERDVEPAVLDSYGDALWWTAMLLTTIGSDYWPRSTEGRLLSLLLSLYALGILGYITATLAAFFVGREAAAAPPNPSGSEGEQ